MKYLIYLMFIIPAVSWSQTPTLPNSPMPDMAKRNFVNFASKINPSSIATLPVQNNGRIKPFDSLARETSLFLTGSRYPLGLDPIQFYLGLIIYEGNSVVEFIELRNKELRQQLGFPKDKRYYSISELERSGLELKSKPLIAKDEENHRSLSTLEKDTLEGLHQYFLAREIASADHFFWRCGFWQY